MPLEDSTFPQDGDPNDGARFAQMLGQSNLLDYVEEGLDVQVDFGTGDVTVTEGVCYIGNDTGVGGTDGKTLSSLGYVVQVAETDITIETSGTKYIYVTPDESQNDKNDINSYDTKQPESNTELLIAIADMDSDSVTEVNRNPSATFEEATIEYLKGQLLLEESFRNAVYATESDLPDPAEPGEQAYVTESETVYVATENGFWQELAVDTGIISSLFVNSGGANTNDSKSNMWNITSSGTGELYIQNGFDELLELKKDGTVRIDGDLTVTGNIN